MRLVVTRLRSLLIPCTLALIFGTLLFQTDRALMKGGEKQRLFTSTTPQSTATNSQTKISGSTFKTASSNTTPAANAFFAPIISAGKSVNLSSASPGATLNYTITIGNSGTTATTGVLFSDTIDANTTLVPGSVNTSPLALTDSYACTGNVGISVPAASGVLINDFDPDGTIPAIVGVNTAGTQGTVSLNPGNGSFTFNPAPGFEGTTTFSYTLSDGVFSDIGTVSITVSGMIWFIDDSVAGPGDGRLSAPFNSVANFNSLAADDPGDNIFVYSGSYSGALTLLNNQKLIGQGATASLVSLAGLTLPPFSNALPATAGTRPTITNSATVLTLGQGNLIRGFNVTNSAGVGISGNNFGTLAASEISVTSTTCSAAVNLTNGNPTASFTSISANNCTNGIILDTLNAAGSFTITGTGTAGSGGTIQNTTGGDSLTGAAGIRMNSVSNVSFNRMQINDHSNYGIRGNSVTNMTLADSVLNGNNGTSTSSAFREGALSIVNLLGSCSFTNTNFSGGSMHTMYIENTGGTLNRLTVDTCTVASTRAGSDDAFQFRPSAGTPTMNVTVQNCTFPSSQTDNFQVPGDAGGSLDVVVTGSTFSNSVPGRPTGNANFIMNVGVPGTPLTATYNIDGNSFRDSNGANIFLLNNHATTMTGKVNNNQVGVAAGAIKEFVGITAAARGNNATHTTQITNNTIRNYDGSGITVEASQGTGQNMNATVTGNTTLSPLANAGQGIYIQLGGGGVAGGNVCLSMTGNNFSAGMPAGGIADIVTDVFATYSLRLPGFAGPFNAAGTDTFLIANNSTGGPTSSTSIFAGASVTGGAACTLPALASPIEADATGSQQTSQNGGNKESTYSRFREWTRPVFSAFAAPTNLSLKALGNWFTPTVKAAENETTALAVSAAMSGETVTKAISVIPPGKTVQIRFQVTVDSPFPAGVCTVSNQGSVSGSGFTTFLTNAATTTILLAPTIGACPTNITTNTDPGLCTAAVTFTPPTATGCPMPTVTCSPASGSAFPKGTTTVTCTATNGVSPNSTCSFTVTVADNQGPNFAGCPTNINANTAAGLCTAPVTYTAPTATDVCDGARTVTCSPASGSSFAKGVTTVTCSASDTSGNSNSCSFTVTVADNQGPVLTACPTSISLNTAAGLCTAVATYTAPTANDVCDGARTVTCSPASGTAFAKGVTTVTCSASDTSGNSNSCSFTVTVADNQAPAVTCPGPINLTESPVGSGSATATFSATANDVCDGARTVTCSPASGSSFTVGVTTVTCSASDTSGNSGSCSFTVTVGIACTINCPSNIVTNTTAGQCGANVNYSTPTATGCGTVTCTPAANSFFPKGTTTVNCTTTAGPSCSFTVTVNDAQGPTLTACPSNIALNTAAGLCTAVATYTAPTANDACDGARTVTCSPASGTAFAKGVTTVTCSALDTLGNSNSCNFTVTVADNQAPTVSCPAPISLTESSPGSGSATATFSATANDVCDGARTVTCTPASGSSFTVGVTTVTCSASDTSGNSGSCSFTVTVASACTISCPGNITVNNSPNKCGANVSYATPTATGCGTVTCTPTSGSMFLKGTTTVTCTTTAGPTCSFTVTVNDTQAPTIACPNNILEISTTPINAIYATPTVSDNCSGVGTVNCVPASGSSFPLGVTTVTCSVSDASGNSASCSFTLTIKTPTQKIVELIAAVQALVPPLNNGQANSLISKLEGAKSDLERGRTTPACNKLRAFINQVEAFINSGKLTPLQGEPLIDCAVMIRQYLGCGNSLSLVSKTVGDFDGDGTSDLAAWQSQSGNWVILDSSTQTLRTVASSGLRLGDSFKDVPVPADYDGDGITDTAIFRRSNATWQIKQSSDGKTIIKQWGLGSDEPVPADYDGDGITDLAVWRGAEGYWYVQQSSDGATRKEMWGYSFAPYLDVPVLGDFDGDSKADFAVFRRSTGTWFIKFNSTGAYQIKVWGYATDIPISADFDGDGKADIAVWRPSDGFWYIIRSSNDSIQMINLGVAGDVPMTGDYDGDGKADVAVWRPGNSNWLARLSRDGSTLTRSLGSTGDTPVPIK